jgi:anti-sigma regulatory factor (Ser/Thr protein kinase)
MEKVTIPAKLENLDLMMGWILKSADLAGFAEKDKFQIKLASEEVLVNIINYAYPSKSGAIELSLNPKPKDSLEIVFADWGIAFDPLSLPEPKLCAPIEERKIGGLGVYLVRKVMDEVNYKREDDKNILTVTKKLKSKK